MIDHTLIHALGAASGEPHDGLALRAIVHGHPDAENPRLYAVECSVGGTSGDYLCKADLLRVIKAWHDMVSSLPA